MAVKQASRRQGMASLDGQLRAATGLRTFQIPSLDCPLLDCALSREKVCNAGGDPAAEETPEEDMGLMTAQSHH